MKNWGSIGLLLASAVLATAQSVPADYDADAVRVRRMDRDDERDRRERCDDGRPGAVRRRGQPGNVGVALEWPGGNGTPQPFLLREPAHLFYARPRTWQGCRSRSNGETSSRPDREGIAATSEFRDWRRVQRRGRYDGY